MSKDETYYFHQTPNEIAKKLVESIDLQEGDVVYEPFKGEGSFYNAFPSNTINKWTELVEGKDYKDFNETYDWVITNPPFKLQETTTTRINSFALLLEYFTDRAKKGVAFLANDYCFSTLTPIRIKNLNNKGWFIHNICVCNIKKWRGRYFFITFKKSPCQFYSAIEGSY